MYLARRRFLHWLAGSAALPALSNAVRAETYPSRPVHIVVGFPSGGPTDIGARLIGQWLAERLGQPFVIENRPGAATNIATEAVAHAAPDGYTLLAAVGTNTINPALYSNLSFNFIRDIAMVAGVFRSPLVLEVIPSVPVKSVPELIAYAKANPGKVTLASFGTATVSHVSGELFKMTAGIDMVHVPYRGSAPLVTDLLGGQVQAAFDNLPASLEHIRAGKLRALAVTTATRSPALPDIPTLAEFQPGFEASAWNALAAPKNTPAEIIDKLSKAINAALVDPKIAARIAEMGATLFVASPAELDKLVVEQTEKWGKVIRAANIKAE
jgi:tripartite-type tricarboxylate transporter receptor subunit TctC